MPVLSGRVKLESMKVVAVIPAYNEVSRIAATIAEILAQTPYILVVDDGSKDGTGARAREAGARVVTHVLNRGQGAALKTGTHAALRWGADYIVHIDADGQHDPACLPSLLEPLQSAQADVVLSSRFLGVKAEGMPRTRRLVLRAARLFNAYILGVPHVITDPQCGLRAFSAEAAKRIVFSHDGMAHASEILREVTRSGLRWREVPTRIRYSAETLAKGVKTTDAFHIAWQLFLGKFQGPRS